MSTERDAFLDAVSGEVNDAMEEWDNRISVTAGSSMAGHVTQRLEKVGALGTARTITTVEELDALPFESVIADAYGTPHVCERHRTDGTHNEWRMSGHNHLINSEDVLYHGPATVLYEPEPQP